MMSTTIPKPILLVDDNPTNLQVLKQTLEDLEHPIVMAESGATAIKIATTQTPALILLDIMMPEMDGYETLAQLHKNHRLQEVPIIFLSALDDLEYKIKGLALGAVDYITKPFQIREVLARVETHLTISQLKAELAQRNLQLSSTNEHILEAVAEGIYGLDQNGIITFANPSATQLTGYKTEELLGKSIYDLHFYAQWDGERYPKEKTLLFQALKNNDTHSIDQDVMWRKAGDHFAAQYTCAPFNADEINKGAVFAFQDITQRKRQENSLKHALSEVEKLKEKLQAENDYLQGEIRTEGKFNDIVGQSKPLLELLDQVEQVASTNSTVLILGESGTGKEAIARAIHEHSQRASHPLIKINCGAISAHLIESELFGHEKGSFTGAIKQRTGYFELADGGTIFLDEVGELPPEAQVKLLRVLQEQEFSRVGSEEITRINVRVIAATNKHLPSLVDQGLFRTDLFYRLNVFPLNIPPLRQRKEDIPLLANHFLQAQNYALGKQLDRITPQSIQLLLNYHWPGNIRELQNVIERSAILNNGNELIVKQGLISASNNLSNLQDPKMASSETSDIKQEKLVTLLENEKNHILRTLALTQWTISGKGGAAEKLDLPASTLRSKMKKLGIQRPN